MMVSVVAGSELEQQSFLYRSRKRSTEKIVIPSAGTQHINIPASRKNRCSNRNQFAGRNWMSPTTKHPFPPMRSIHRSQAERPMVPEMLSIRLCGSNFRGVLISMSARCQSWPTHDQQTRPAFELPLRTDLRFSKSSQTICEIRQVRHFLVDTRRGEILDQWVCS